MNSGSPSAITGVTELYAQERSISNLTGIEYCIRLHTLDLDHNQISDLNPLSGLRKLGWLDLWSNQITNLSPLDSLTSLGWLDLRENRISGLAPLSSLTSLGWLDLGNTQINDLSPLSSLSNLQGLSLWGNRINDVSPLAGMIQLNSLHLNDNQIGDISPLSSLTNLQWLNMAGNQISDISPLSSLTNLQVLYSHDNQINDISLLGGLTNLQVLYSRSNQISDIGPLSSLTNLQQLDLESNQISDISFLSSLTNLQSLGLADNEISDINPLSSLTNLQRLILHSNQISDISSLSHLTDMRELYLDHNQIQDISPLEIFTKIGEWEDWAWEREGIGVHLGLSNNQISDISPLVNNAGIGDGDGVDLRGNPLDYEVYGSSISALEERGVNLLFDLLRKTVYVATTGDDAIGDGSEERPFATIQKGIDTALDGGTVWVADGTHTGDGNRDLDFNGKRITVASVNGPEVTMIDCQGTAEEPHRGFYFHSGEDSTSMLTGFTITNGWAVGEGQRGGGIHCQGGSPTITNNMLTGNSAGNYGGGICVDDASPIMRDNVLTKNWAGQDGAGIYCWQSSAVISRNTLRENTAQGQAGGIYCHTSSLSIIGNTLTENTAGNDAGAIYCYISSPVIRGNTFTRNSASNHAGGVLCNQHSPTIIDNIFTENTAENDGGAMYTINCSPTIRDNSFTRNSAADAGGGIFCNGDSPTITGNTLIENSASSNGGGIVCFGSSATILGNIITGNLASASGGGIRCGKCSPIIANNVIASNTARWSGGISSWGSASPTIVNNTITDNKADGGGGISTDDTSYSTILNTILWMNTPSEIQADDPSTIRISYSDIQDGWEGEDNIDADPLFIGAAYGDYHLTDYSPCIGAGMADLMVPETDIEGNPRGTPPDMGAYENMLDTPVEGLVVSVPDTIGISGDSIRVPIGVDDATGIAGVEITLTYNPTILTATGVQKTALTTNFVLTDTPSEGQIKISLASGTGIPSGNGSLVEVTFRVSEDATPGDTTSMVLESVALYDELTRPMAVSAKNGVFRVNRPPMADAGPDTVRVLDADRDSVEEVTLDGSGSTDLDGTIEAYEWREDEAVLGTVVSIRPSFSGGRHVVTLVVADNLGVTDTDSITVIVAQAPIAEAKAEPDTAWPFLQVALDGRGSHDPEGDLLAYRWTQSMDNPARVALSPDSTAQKPTFTPEVPGDYLFMLTVSDGELDSDPDSVKVTVEQPPISDGGPDTVRVVDADGDGVEEVTLDGSGSMDPDGTIEAYEWREDKAVLGTVVSIHPSFSVGTHVVILTVTDNIGAADTDTVVVIVEVGLAVIQIFPDSVIVEVGKAQPFTVKGFDGVGNRVVVSPAWRVVPSEIGDVSMDSVFTAKVWGEGRVIAIQEGVTDTATVVVGILGDVNFDGLVDVRDAIICLRIEAELPLPPLPLHETPTAYERWAADMNRDEVVEANDALLILYKSHGRPVGRPVHSLAGEKALVLVGEVSEGSQDLITVLILVKGRADVYAADVRLRYDPELLTPVEVRSGVSGALLVSNTRKEGRIIAALVSTEGLVGSDGSLLSISFEVKGTLEGREPFQFEKVRLFDASAEGMDVHVGDRFTATERTIPQAYGLSQNIPNPFNARTEIRVQLPQEGRVALRVYNLNGQVVRTLVQDPMGAGEWRIVWDGSDEAGREVSSGVYVYRLVVDDVWTKTMKMILLR